MIPTPSQPVPDVSDFFEKSHMLSLLRLMKRLRLPAAKTAGECSWLTPGNGVIHEVMVVTDPVVVRALEPFDFSYHSHSNWFLILNREFFLVILSTLTRRNALFFQKST